MEPEPEAVEQAYETELAAEDSSKRRYLVCSTCRFPIAGPEDLLLERIECWRPAVFQYLFSLDEGHVIEEESETGGAAPERGDHGYPDGTLEPLVVWAYSATNPTSHRFDVVRIRPTPAIKFERPRGGPDHWTRPTPDHCWFPGTAWRQAYCAVCGDHMGWGYSAWTEESASGSAQGTPQGSEALPSPTSASPTESNGSAPSPTSPTYIANSEAPVLFVGLILTRVVPSDLGEAEVACFVRERNDFALNPVFNNRYLSSLRGAMTTLNRLPVALASIFYAPLQEMRLRPQLRTTIDEVSRMISAMAGRVQGAQGGGIPQVAIQQQENGNVNGDAVEWSSEEDEEESGEDADGDADVVEDTDTDGEQ